MKVQFNDAVSRVQGLDSFFYLLNQYTGVTTSIPATCIKVANDFTVEFNVIDCFGDVLDAKTVYVDEGRRAPDPLQRQGRPRQREGVRSPDQERVL